MTYGNCPGCNTPNEYSEICCTMCGKRLPWATLPARESPPTMAQVKPLRPTSQFAISKGSRSRLWAVLGIFAFIIVAAMLKRIRLPVSPVFDIPSLVDKSIDEVQAELGAPHQAISSLDLVPHSVTQHKLAWKRGNVKLTASYSEATRKVIGFYMTTDDPSGESADRARTLALGNLKEGDMTVLRYSVVFVVGSDISKHVGVRVDVYL